VHSRRYLNTRKENAHIYSEMEKTCRVPSICHAEEIIVSRIFKMVNMQSHDCYLIWLFESSAVEFLLIRTLEGRLWEELKIASPNYSMFYPSILYRCIFHSNAPPNLLLSVCWGGLQHIIERQIAELLWVKSFVHLTTFAISLTYGVPRPNILQINQIIHLTSLA